MKLLLIAGARPNFMKVAPLIHAIQRHNASVLRPPSSGSSPPSVPCPPISYKLVHTGQHYDEKMSEVFFLELGIPAPDINLEVGSGSHALQTARIMERFEPVLLSAFQDTALTSALELQTSDSSTASPLRLGHGESLLRSGEKVAGGRMRCASGEVSPPAPSSVLCPPSSVVTSLPDWVVVVGDVNSTMACTLVASKLGVKVAHVEAGLRSFDRTMPEEINRLVTDALADLLLTPSEDANENLRREGVPEHRIRLVGNIMIDSLVANLPQARASTILQQWNLEPGNFAYVTLHRPSNVDQASSLRPIMAELTRLSERLPVVFPIHPRTRTRLAEFGIPVPSSVLRPPSSAPISASQHVSVSAFEKSVVSGPQPEGRSPTLLLLDPLGYHDSLCLTENARLVLTDSGGLQEESTWFRTPCLTLRPNTERPITVTHGSNRLTNVDRLRHDLAATLQKPDRIGQVPPLWDGHAALRIISALQTALA